MMTNQVLCIIPARIASTRLPRKPLALIGGIPMVSRTLAQARACPDVHRVIVATDDQTIAQVITEQGGEVVMTDPNIATGSDRVAVVARQYPNYDIIVNLQGDEPFIHPESLSALVKPFLREQDVVMSTLAFRLNMKDEYGSPAIVKVIVDQNFDAIYFSRAPIPYLRQTVDQLPVFHHQGVYAFRREFLHHYTTLAQTPLEKAESLEQLRALENGYKIRVCVTPHATIEINTPEELTAANARFRE
jgi:3-deoxy-manno-octulosonate cytidylyltransferase (CMP-KDO synthetase)